MKRKLLALLICSQIILSAFVPIFTTVAATEGDTGSSDTGSGTTVTSSVTSIFPDSKLTWLSYSDYLLDQATNAWNDPKMYVGYEVQFLDCYTSAELRNGFGAGSSSIFPSLYFGVEEETRGVNTIDLTTVKLGSGLTTLGNGAFYSCEKLTSVTFAKTSGWKAGDTALSTEDVANTETAATYLRANYNGVVWKRG